ncbi:MAG TPA: MFS transporter [Nitrospirae bacterium]|nr:muropeptide transporter [bacterium BMS3Abin06]HDH12341.1 MFS transporter [Nitrospirota bacterium]HDZ00368.1 MFS transporter [Nitrospirota bacterium]
MQHSMIKTIFSRRMLVSFIMGFACGLPLLLTKGVLQAWMKKEGIDLSLIGLTNLLAIPYSIKFLWAPFLDRYSISFFGRRRGWLLIAQLALMLSIAAMGLSNPKNTPILLVLAALTVTFFSASQDIVVDAYRREDLADEELGLGSALYVLGYRTGMLLASGGGLIMADYVSFNTVYLIIAACMLPAIITTLMTPEPHITAIPKTIREAVIDPLVEYFSRRGALWILAFILMYKIGDIMASNITTPFYMEMGFSLTEIGAITKLLGFWAIIAGASIGGVIMLRIGINRSLWVFGILQAISTAGFAVLARIGHSIPGLAAVIGFENLSAGMGTAAFMAFMASITNKKFTATQYALLTSFMAFGRDVLSAPTGFLAKHMGWENFFIGCVLIAIPGMLLLLKFAPWNSKEGF